MQGYAFAIIKLAALQHYHQHNVRPETAEYLFHRKLEKLAATNRLPAPLAPKPTTYAQNPAVQDTLAGGVMPLPVSTVPHPRPTADAVMHDLKPAPIPGPTPKPPLPMLQGPHGINLVHGVNGIEVRGAAAQPSSIGSPVAAKVNVPVATSTPTADALSTAKKSATPRQVKLARALRLLIGNRL